MIKATTKVYSIDTLRDDVLRILLKDNTRTTYESKRLKYSGKQVAEDFQSNIIWATTDYYTEKGECFDERDEITEEDVVGLNRIEFCHRSRKKDRIQRQRSKDMAEVFTPAWVCNAQNNLIDDAWFGRKEVFNREFTNENGEHIWVATQEPIKFAEEPSAKSTRSWKDYVRDIRMEITCGEAPYIVSRYDCVTGKEISNLSQRIGLLDRKLRIVSENTTTSTDWLEWAHEAVRSVYGFEWQGDNLLFARAAILFTVMEYYDAKAKKECWRYKFSKKSMRSFAEIISWNIWQMDGLKMVLPYSCDEGITTDLFGEKLSCPACARGLNYGHIGIKCLVRDWKKRRGKREIEFESLLKANTSGKLETKNE